MNRYAIGNRTIRPLKGWTTQSSGEFCRFGHFFSEVVQALPAGSFHSASGDRKDEIARAFASLIHAHRRRRTTLAAGPAF